MVYPEIRPLARRGIVPVLSGKVGLLGGGMIRPLVRSLFGHAGDRMRRSPPDALVGSVSEGLVPGPPAPTQRHPVSLADHPPFFIDDPDPPPEMERTVGLRAHLD